MTQVETSFHGSGDILNHDLQLWPLLCNPIRVQLCLFHRQSGSIEMVIGTDIVAKDGSKVTLSAKYVGE